jgi:gluconokinase
MMGVSGSGKTEIGKRLAGELNWPFFDGDDFHPPANVEKMQQSIPLTDEDRDVWLDALQDLIAAHINAGQPAIIACSALKQVYRDRLNIGQSVQFIYLKGSYDLIHHRLEQRTDHYMPTSLLNSQFEALEEPENALVIDVAQPPNTLLSVIQEKLGHVLS